MNNTLLYIVWAALYVACAALGALGAPTAVGIIACIGFFIPPALLLWRSGRSQDRKTPRRIRNLSMVWLGVTLVLLILNILSVALSETAGDVLYCLMAVVSSPMVCGKKWIIAIFLWSYVLMESRKQLKK